MVFRSEDDKVLLADTRMGYSVFTIYEVITTGTATTDPEGLLSISFVTPGIGSQVKIGTNLDILITCEVDGEMEHFIVPLVCWDEMGYSREWYDDGTTVEVEQASPGGNLSVTVSNPQVDGSSEKAWFVWGLEPIKWDMDISYVERNWTRVSTGTMFGGMEMVPGEYSEGEYTADIPIPDFVPDGSLLFVVGVIESPGESGQVWRLAYFEGFSYTAEVEDDDDGILESSIPDWYMWILVLIIISVAVVGLLLLMRK